MTPFPLRPFPLLPLQLLLTMFHKFSRVSSQIIFEHHAHRDGNFALPHHLTQRREPDYASDDPHVEAAASQQACHRTDPYPKQDHFALTTRRP